MRISNELEKFAYVPQKHIELLANLAQKENWNYLNPTKETISKYPILYNYIKYTFRRLAELFNNDNNSNYIIFDKKYIAINTGLMTENFETIYMLFSTTKNEKRQHYCVGFFKESRREVQELTVKPLKAKYIESLEDLLYDTSLPLKVNIDHILKDPENMSRLPEKLRNSPTLVAGFYGAIEILKKKLEQNYKIAVPQIYNNHMQFLLPICLQNMENADLVLAVEKHKTCYTGHTCLTLDMAYNNARLIAKPEIDWLLR